MDSILQELQSEIARSLNGLSASQTQLRPISAEEKWTIQQIAQHLCLSYESTGAAIQSRLDKGRPTRSAPALRQRWLQFLITNLGWFPPGREAPPVVRPPKAPTSSEHQLAGDALGQQVAFRMADMDMRMDDAEAVFGERRVVSHAILGPLTVAQWRRFHRTHGLHHVRQIWSIRRERGV